MQTTREQILNQLKLLPESRLREVLLFVEFLLSRLNYPVRNELDSPSTFTEALTEFRAQVETEGSDIEEVDFFADARDSSLASEEPNW